MYFGSEILISIRFFQGYYRYWACYAKPPSPTNLPVRTQNSWFQEFRTSLPADSKSAQSWWSGTVLPVCYFILCRNASSDQVSAGQLELYLRSINTHKHPEESYNPKIFHKFRICNNICTSYPKSGVTGRKRVSAAVGESGSVLRVARTSTNQYSDIQKVRQDQGICSELCALSQTGGERVFKIKHGDCFYPSHFPI